MRRSNMDVLGKEKRYRKYLHKYQHIQFRYIKYKH